MDGARPKLDVTTIAVKTDGFIAIPLDNNNASPLDADAILVIEP